MTGERNLVAVVAAKLHLQGMRTGGDARNRSHLEGHVTSTTSAALEALAYDPQTSGGLLASVAAESVEALTGAGFVAIGSVGPGAAAVELS